MCCKFVIWKRSSLLKKNEKGELFCSDKSDLGNVAVAKIKKLFCELEEHKSNKSSDAVERIKSGFIHFKTHKFLYVLFLINSVWNCRFQYQTYSTSKKCKNRHVSMQFSATMVYSFQFSKIKVNPHPLKATCFN